MARAAGILVFVENNTYSRMASFVAKVNGDKRVSSEVLSIYLVTPTRDATRELAHKLRENPDLQHLERIGRLKPNNVLRDLTAPWRLSEHFTNNHTVVVNLETVNPDFRKKYPDPNLTLPAGSIEDGESVYDAAHRELFEETRIRVHPSMLQRGIGLFRGGILMFPVVVTHKTPMYMTDDNSLVIGFAQIYPRYRSIVPFSCRHHIISLSTSNGRQQSERPSGSCTIAV